MLTVEINLFGARPVEFLYHFIISNFNGGLFNHIFVALLIKCNMALRLIRRNMAGPDFIH